MPQKSHPPADHGPHAKAAHHEPPPDVAKAAALVAERFAEYAAKKEALKPLHAAFVKADEEATDAGTKLRDAEEGLLTAARAQKVEPPPADAAK